MRILLTGGGTGGHLNPIIAVSQELKKIYRREELNNLELLYLGPRDPFVEKLLSKENIGIKLVAGGKLRRYFSIKNFFDLPKILAGIFQALWHVFIFMPDVIFGKGGYGCLPIMIAGYLYRIPILIHESDTVPGLSNLFAGRIASKIAVSFSEARKFFPAQKTALLGIPVLEELKTGSKEKGVELFNLSRDSKILLIIGGSQGSQRINTITFKTLSDLLEKYEVIHISGRGNYEVFEKEVKNQFSPQFLKNYHLLDYLEPEYLAHAYAAADLIISRAGASSIYEISALGKPSILIPLAEAASDHQRKNAFSFARLGGTLVMEEQNLTPNLFLDKISDLMNDSSLLKTMGENAKKLHRPDAAHKIAEALIELGKEKNAN